MNALQQINKTIQGKSDIEAYASAQISAALEEGEIPVLELRRRAVMLSELSKRLIADDTLREACVTELEKYGSREDVTLCGAKFRIKETGVSYDYEPCGASSKKRRPSTPSSKSERSSCNTCPSKGSKPSTRRPARSPAYIHPPAPQRPVYK